jgi:hypothetical protein
MRYGLGLALMAVWAMSAMVAGTAQAGDLYTVERLAVDAIGASPSEARDKALAQGRERAFGIIYKRLTVQAQWPSVPQLAPEELEEMVSSFAVDNERHSATRYLANASFTFSAQGVRSALRRFGMTFSETSAKPVVVLPIQPGVGWSNDTLWAQSWASVARRGSLKPVIVPLGDASEQAMVGNVIVEAATWEQVSGLAQKYGSTEVWLTSVAKTPNGLQVAVTVLRNDGRRDSRFTIIANAGESEGQMSVRAAAMVRASYEEAWKAETAVNYGSHSFIEAAVAFTSLPDWVSLRRELSDIRLIQQVNVLQMLTQGARIRVKFLGRKEQLRGALKQADIVMTELDNGLQILARSGVDTSTLPAALLEAPPANFEQVSDQGAEQPASGAADGTGTEPAAPVASGAAPGTGAQ